MIITASLFFYPYAGNADSGNEYTKIIGSLPFSVVKRTAQPAPHPFLAAAVTSLIFLPLILIGHWVAAGISFMCLIAVTSSLNPTVNHFSQSLVDAEWRTTMASAISLTTGIAIAVTAFGDSQIIILFGYRAFFLVAAVLILLGSLFFRFSFGEWDDTLAD